MRYNEFAVLSEVLAFTRAGDSAVKKAVPAYDVTSTVVKVTPIYNPAPVQPAPDPGQVVAQAIQSAMPAVAQAGAATAAAATKAQTPQAPQQSAGPAVRDAKAAQDAQWAASQGHEATAQALQTIATTQLNAQQKAALVQQALTQDSEAMGIDPSTIGEMLVRFGTGLNEGRQLNEFVPAVIAGAEVAAELGAGAALRSLAARALPYIAAAGPKVAQWGKNLIKGTGRVAKDVAIGVGTGALNSMGNGSSSDSSTPTGSAQSQSTAPACNKQPGETVSVNIGGKSYELTIMQVTQGGYVVDASAATGSPPGTKTMTVPC
jgi:hypothetical protein